MSRDLAGSRRQNPLLLSGHGGRLGNGPAWAPGWLHKDDASSKMREFRLELPDRERVPPVSLQHKKTREPLAAWQTGWRHLGGRESPRGSQHFFGSLAPLRSSMSLEQNEATRALMHFLPPRDTVVQKRHRVRSVLDDAVGTSMPLFAEDTEPPPTKAHQVKDAMLGAAEVPHWNERLGARPNPRVSATDKGLIWGHAHVLVDDQGKLHVQPRGKHHGCSAREIDLKHALLDSVRGSLFVVLEEIQKEVPRLDTSSANQSRLEQVYLLQVGFLPWRRRNESLGYGAKLTGMLPAACRKAGSLSLSSRRKRRSAYHPLPFFSDSRVTSRNSHGLTSWYSKEQSLGLE